MNLSEMFKIDSYCHLRDFVLQLQYFKGITLHNFFYRVL